MKFCVPIALHFSLICTDMELLRTDDLIEINPSTGESTQLDEADNQHTTTNLTAVEVDNW